MPISPPKLDDRNFEDLVAELLARIPAHTPEWVPQPGDPGRTLLELFAWLGETILYRANLIPERQRLAFLKLLGQQMQPARAARGLVSVNLNEAGATDVVKLAAEAIVSGPVDFETRSELAVLPVSAECYYKRPLSDHEQQQSEVLDVLDGLKEFHGIDGVLAGYVTTPAFDKGLAISAGIDLISDTSDKSLWIALLAAGPGQVTAIKETLAGTASGRPELLSLGFAPAIEVPDSFEDRRRPGRIPHVVEISTGELFEDRPVYTQLSRIADSTEDLTRRGVERYVLPGDPGDFGVLEGDVRVDANAGVGDRPPRLDDPDKLARIVAWLRLRPARPVTSMPISWAGVNAVEIEHLRTIRGRVIGQSNGAADQVMQLPARSVEAATLELQVEESGRGYVDWQRVDDVAVEGRDDTVYMLDREAGTVTFGNGVYGRTPEIGRRVRVRSMRAGGGRRGNLPASSLGKISARDLNGNPVERKLAITQGLATEGGEDAEDLVTAERRIPARIRHRNRCVTEVDYRSLVMETPAVNPGRVEVLPRFMPHQRRENVPGVVSVMVLPDKALTEAPNPRPDQPFIEKVYTWLDHRRPLATELYVIGCEYVAVGLSVGITVSNGSAYDQVVNDVREALKRYLWSLAPHGPNARGWPLGKNVVDRELEVAVARVDGVSTVGGLNLFRRDNGSWKKIEPAQKGEIAVLPLAIWQLPELLTVVISTDGEAGNDLRGAPLGEAGDGAVAVPIVPEVC